MGANFVKVGVKRYKLTELGTRRYTVEYTTKAGDVRTGARDTTLDDAVVSADDWITLVGNARIIATIVYEVERVQEA